MPSRTFAFSRFPVLGMLFAAVWALARLGLLVLLIWLIVRFTLRSTKPVPAAPTTPADHAPDTSAPEN